LFGCLHGGDDRGTATELQTLRFKQGPRPTYTATSSTQHQTTDKAGTTNETTEGGHQTAPAAHRLHCLTLRQPKSRTASLIARDYQNPERHKNKSLEKGA
jgi:hypothetical protein